MGAPVEELWLAEDVMPLGQLLLRSARRDPDKEALVFPGERLTYRELADRAWGVAESLVALGIEPGEHVGVLMTNHPDLVASVFGASLVGAVVVPINARYRFNELRFLIEDADLVALLTHDALVATLEAEWAAQAAPWEAAANIILDDVIPPEDTRRTIAMGIDYAWGSRPRVTEGGC